MSANETLWLTTALANAQWPARELTQGLVLSIWPLALAGVWLYRLCAELPQAARLLMPQARRWALCGLVFAWLLYALALVLALGAAQAHLDFMRHLPGHERIAGARGGVFWPWLDAVFQTRALGWAGASLVLVLSAELLRAVSWWPSRRQARRNAQELLERLQQAGEPEPRQRSVVNYR